MKEEWKKKNTDIYDTDPIIKPSVQVYAMQRIGQMIALLIGKRCVLPRQHQSTEPNS